MIPCGSRESCCREPTAVWDGGQAGRRVASGGAGAACTARIAPIANGGDCRNRAPRGGRAPRAIAGRPYTLGTGARTRAGRNPTRRAAPGYATLPKAARSYIAAVELLHSSWTCTAAPCARSALTCGFLTCSFHLKMRRKLVLHLCGERATYSTAMALPRSHFPSD